MPSGPGRRYLGGCWAQKAWYWSSGRPSQGDRPGKRLVTWTATSAGPPTPRLYYGNPSGTMGGVQHLGVHHRVAVGDTAAQQGGRGYILVSNGDQVFSHASLFLNWIYFLVSFLLSQRLISTYGIISFSVIFLNRNPAVGAYMRQILLRFIISR